MGTQVTKQTENAESVRQLDDFDKTLLRVDADATIRSRAVEATGSTAELVPGDVVKDRFEIVSILGRGGMGVVYRAIDRRKVEAQDRDPHVALKALSATWQQDDRMVIALQREARKAQTLAHPNIATVFDFDRDGDLVYITMEQLAGQPLDEVIRQHPQGMPRHQVKSIIRGLCLGLAYAHNKGIVHSDFKPGNVFLNEGFNPKILDFGIARATPVAGDASASSQTQFDAGDLGALTPSYAALEMFQGAPPHPADDVYALAITAYQLLGGRHPFNSQPAPKARAAGMKPEPLRGLKRREWQAIRGGLEFERKNRIAHAQEFLRVFEGRKSALLAISAAALLAVALGAYYAYVQVEEHDRIAPDTAFTALPENTQSLINQHLADGDMSRKFGDYAGALASYEQAYALHPRNPDVTGRLIDLLTGLVNSAVNQGTDRSALLANLEDIMVTDGFLGTHPRLKDLRQKLETTR